VDATVAQVIVSGLGEGRRDIGVQIAARNESRRRTDSDVAGAGDRSTLAPIEGVIDGNTYPNS
jgi:hypothetical protein